MKEFITHPFDLALCQQELNEFKELLDNKTALSEKDDILPFFKERKHLSAYLGSFFPDIGNFDKLAYEYKSICSKIKNITDTIPFRYSIR